MSGIGGTWPLVRLILRRDRLWLALWVLIVGFVPVGMASSFAELMTTAQALREYAEANASTPATIGVLGYVYSATVGGLTAWRAGLNGAFLIVPVSIILLVRYTRTEEAAGRAELLGSAVVGRQAALAAALIVVCGANLAIAVIVAGGLIALGLPVAGSIVMGLSAPAAGCVFAALAGVLAQATQSPGPARGIALAALALTWLVRAVGDLSSGGNATSWLAWISPLGWVRNTRAFAGEQWWVFGLFAALTAGLMYAAFALSARRDLGAGLLPARLGPAVAAPSLSSPLALAWRLQRPTLLGWSAGALAFGSLLGSVATSISRFTDAPQFAEWAARVGAPGIGDAFLFLTIYVLGQTVSVYAIAAVLRLRSEEVEGRADPLLAAPVSRLRWALSHLFSAAVGATVIMALLGVTIGAGYGAGSGNLAGDLPRLLLRTLAVLPAAWVMAGIAAAAYGLAPRVAGPLAWGLLSFFFLLELGWELQRIGTDVFGLSPFAWVHWTRTPSAGALLGLTLLAAALAAAGLWGFGRRDVG